MTEPRWDAVYVTITNKQITQVMKGLVVRIDITADDHNQPLVVPTAVFIRRGRARPRTEKT